MRALRMLYGDDGFICKSDGPRPTQTCRAVRGWSQRLFFAAVGPAKRMGLNRPSVRTCKNATAAWCFGGKSARLRRGQSPVFMRLYASPQNDFVDNSGLHTNLPKR